MIYSGDQNLLDLATELAYKILGEKGLNLNIDVDYDEELDVEAQVIQVDKDEYEILLRDDVENLRTALAHELIHVKQYAEGRLADTNLGMFWEGKFIDTNKVKYSDLPWEVEAHALEGNY
jgi:hypothetical protein